MPARHVAAANIAHLPLLHQPAQRLQRLREGRGLVPDVSIEQVDIGGLQSLQALLNTPDDVVTAQTWRVDVTGNGVATAFGGQNYLRSVLSLQPLSNYPLRLSVLSGRKIIPTVLNLTFALTLRQLKVTLMMSVSPYRINISRVKKVSSSLDKLVENLESFSLAAGPGVGS